MMRAESTRLMAAPLFPPPTWAASAVMASSPSQSPVADTTLAPQAEEHCEPNTRSGRPTGGLASPDRAGGLLRSARLRSSWGQPSSSWPSSSSWRRLLLATWPGSTPASRRLGEELGGPLEGHALDGVTLAERGVGVAVGHVGPEPAVLDHDGLAGDGVVTELAQGTRRPAARRALGSARTFEALVERDREELLLDLQAPGLGALLQVRPVPAVLAA